MSGRGVVLRPERLGDAEFLARLYASTRAEELEGVPFTTEQRSAFLELQFRAQGLDYGRRYPDASSDVVLVEGRPAGRLMVAREKREIRVIDVALLPEHRSRGLGTQLLRSVIAEAQERGATVALSVPRGSHAVRLYERLGFVPVGDDGVYLAMERPPAAAHAKTAS